MGSQRRDVVNIWLDVTGSVGALQTDCGVRHYQLRHEGVELVADALGVSDRRVYRIHTPSLTSVATCLGAAILNRVSNSRVLICVERSGGTLLDLELASGGWLATRVDMVQLAFPREQTALCRLDARDGSRTVKSRTQTKRPNRARTRRSPARRRRGSAGGSNAVACRVDGVPAPPPGRNPRTGRTKASKAARKRAKARRAKARYAGRPVPGVITVWNRRRR